MSVARAAIPRLRRSIADAMPISESFEVDTNATRTSSSDWIAHLPGLVDGGVTRQEFRVEPVLIGIVPIVEADFVVHLETTISTDPDAGWVFVVDQLNTHQSESLVRLVARVRRQAKPVVVVATQAVEETPAPVMPGVDGAGQ